MLVTVGIQQQLTECSLQCLWAPIHKNKNHNLHILLFFHTYNDVLTTESIVPLGTYRIQCARGAGS